MRLSPIPNGRSKGKLYKARDRILSQSIFSSKARVGGGKDDRGASGGSGGGGHPSSDKSSGSAGALHVAHPRGSAPPGNPEPTAPLHGVIGRRNTAVQLPQAVSVRDDGSRPREMGPPLSAPSSSSGEPRGPGGATGIGRSQQQSASGSGGGDIIRPADGGGRGFQESGVTGSRTSGLASSSSGYLPPPSESNKSSSGQAVAAPSTSLPGAKALAAAEALRKQQQRSLALAQKALAPGRVTYLASPTRGQQGGGGKGSSSGGAGGHHGDAARGGGGVIKRSLKDKAELLAKRQRLGGMHLHLGGK